MKLFAKYVYPNNGTENDHRKNAKAGLAEGMSYVVEALRVGSWSSCVYLEDYFEKSFNTINFEFYDEFGCEVNIYADPRTAELRRAEIYTVEETQARCIIRNISEFEAATLNAHGVEWNYVPGCRDIVVYGGEKAYHDARRLLLTMNETTSIYSVRDFAGKVSHLCLTREAAQCLRAAGCAVAYIADSKN
jgi:hypothetical protein